MSDSNPTDGKRHYLAWSVAGLLAGLGVAALAWWYVGTKVWTDGREVRVSAARTDPREVLWTPPKSLGEGFNTPDQEYEPSISPDGTELYFVRGKAAKNADIYVSRRQNNRWTEPVALEGVNSAADDLGPRLTPDGRFLLFYSDRPGGQGGYDIWAAHRRDDGGWDEPFNLGPSINTEFNEYSPAPTPDGKKLYFATNRKAANREQKEAWRATIRQDAVGDYDLFVAILDEAPPVATGIEGPVGATFASPSSAPKGAFESNAGETSLAPTSSPAERDTRLAYRAAAEVVGVNTPFHEGASCVSTHGDFLYFASNRPGGFGKFDIYRCRLSDDGTPGPVENLGPQINTTENEADPQLAVGGFQLYFSSDRAAPEARGGYDLFSAESREVYALRQGRPVPHLGWSWWVLLGSIILLVPLLKFLRGWNDRHLNVLQKCLLVSLLLHVLLTLSLSFIAVTHQVMELARQDAGAGGMGEVTVVGDGGSGLDIAMAIRGGGAGGPGIEASTEPPPAVEQRAASAPEAFTAPDVLDVGVPQARVAPAAGEMVVAQPMPARAVPANTSQRVTVAPDGPELVAPQVDLALQRPVSEAEKAAQVAPAAADVVAEKTVVPGASAAESPAPVEIAVGAAKRDGGSATPQAAVALPAASRPGTFKAQPFQPAPDLADVSGPVAIDAPRGVNPAYRVSEQGASALPAALEAPGGPAGLAGFSRQSNGSGAGSAPSAPKSVDVNVPGAAPSGQSFATSSPGLPTGRAGGAPNGAPSGAGASANIPAVKVDATAAGTGPDGVGASIAKAAGGAGAQRVAEAGPAIAVGEGQISVARAPERSDATEGGGAAGPGGARAALQPGSSGAPAARPGDGSESVAMSALPSTRPATLVSGIGGTGSGSVAPRVGPESVAGPAAVGAPATDAGSRPVSQPEVASGARGPGPDQPLPSSRQDTGAAARAGGPDALKVAGLAGTGAGAAPATAVGTGSLASAAPTGARSMVAGGTRGVGSPVARPGDVASPALDLTVASPGAAKAIARGPAGGGRSLPEVSDEAITASQRLSPGTGADERPGALASAGGFNTPIVPGKNPGPSQSLLSHGAAIGPRAGDIAAAPLNLEVAITTPTLAVPEPMEHRSPEARKPLLQKMGGTPESEEAVGLALAYLARQQEPDGRWTYVSGGSRPGQRSRGSHDMALTGLATLVFLASDHTPTREGPYRDQVSAAVEYLLNNQRPSGDLRGRQAGGGADAGNMYDQGIATLALAEAALMTGDKRIIDGAMRGAAFIVKGQSRESGGWRYMPGEFGDTSVFGWQIMALHSAKQLGFEVPESSRQGALHYVELASQGSERALAGYQPGVSPTPAMSAEMLFARILLGEDLTEDMQQEASDFLTRRLPNPRQADLYCWYYSSLSLLQLQNDAWTKWNQRTRETLIKMQKRGGKDDGCWDGNIQWADRGGRIYSTALGALTLEVYYRYLPMSAERGAPGSQPATTPARPDIGYLAH